MKKSEMDLRYKKVKGLIIWLCQRYGYGIEFDEAMSIANMGFVHACGTFLLQRSKNAATFETYLRSVVKGKFENHRKMTNRKNKKHFELFEQKKSEARNDRRLRLDEFMLDASNDAATLVKMVINPKGAARHIMQSTIIRNNVDPGKLMLKLNNVLKWDHERLLNAYVEVQEFVNG